MRILYIANYQGPDVVAQRVLTRNRALGGSRKIELIGRLLQNQGHEVVILSLGIAAESSGRMFRAVESTTSGMGNGGVPVWYAAGLDVRWLNYLVALVSSIRWLRRRASQQAFDVLLTYNIDELSFLITQFYLRRIRRIPLVLEYEDSVAEVGRGTHAVRHRIWRRLEQWLAPRLAGVLSVNAALAGRVENPNTYVLPGVVEEELCQAARSRRAALSGEPPYLALYCGSMFPDKGVEIIPEIAGQFKGRVRFVIAGMGPLLDDLVAAARNCGGDVEVLGYLERRELNNLLVSADILLNPHRDVPAGGVLPFKLVEYAVAGGVVVTTAMGRVRHEILDYCEVTRPNRDDLAATLERVLDRRDEVVVRAGKAQAWAISRYSASAVGDSLNRVLSNAVGLHSSALDRRGLS